VSIAAQNLELRVLLFDGQQYAVYSRLSVRGHDIYTGSGAHFDGREIFRHSHHASGQTHLRVADKIVSREERQRPASISGRLQLSAVSNTLPGLDWTYKPKKESRTRRNVIIDMRSLTVPSFTAEVWAIEPGQRSQVDAVLAEFQNAKIITHDHIDWTAPEFVIVAWSLPEQAWQSLMKPPI
jgi:hypothetical protein